MLTGVLPGEVSSCSAAELYAAGAEQDTGSSNSTCSFESTRALSEHADWQDNFHAREKKCVQLAPAVEIEQSSPTRHPPVPPT